MATLEISNDRGVSVKINLSKLCYVKADTIFTVERKYNPDDLVIRLNSHIIVYNNGNNEQRMEFEEKVLRDNVMDKIMWYIKNYTYWKKLETPMGDIIIILNKITHTTINDKTLRINWNYAVKNIEFDSIQDALKAQKEICC